MVRFLIRLQKLPELNREFDREALKKRPYRDRQVDVFIVAIRVAILPANCSHHILFEQTAPCKKYRVFVFHSIII